MYHCRKCLEELSNLERQRYQGYCMFCYEQYATEDMEVWRALDEVPLW